jgi:predicted HTH transcriptional regulator
VKTEGQEVERWRDAYARRLKQNVAEGIAPEIRPVLEWIDAAGRSVLRITVPPGARTPHEVTETREIYVRRGATSRRPTPVEMRSLFYPADSPHTASSFLGGLAAKGRNRLR